MNIQQEEDAIERLPPEKYNTRNLVIAISVLASAVAGLFIYVRVLVGDMDKIRQEQLEREERRSDKQVQQVIDILRPDLKEIKDNVQQAKENVDSVKSTKN